MKSKKLSELPIPQSGCGKTRLVSNGVTLTLEFEYRTQGTDWIGAVEFDSILAYRFRNEMHSAGYCSDAYEAIGEIEVSTWIEEMRRVAPKGINDVRSKRHFAAFLSSNGFFEVLADGYKLLEIRKGIL